MCPGAGEAAFRAFSVDLDDAPPQVSYESNAGGPFGLTLAKGETEALTVSASAGRATYQWRLRFDVIVDGERETIDVGPPGGFTTTAGPRGARWTWNFSDAWILQRADARPVPSRRVPAGAPLPPVPTARRGSR